MIAKWTAYSGPGVSEQTLRMKLNTKMPSLEEIHDLTCPMTGDSSTQFSEFILVRG